MRFAPLLVAKRAVGGRPWVPNEGQLAAIAYRWAVQGRRRQKDCQPVIGADGDVSGSPAQLGTYLLRPLL